MGKKRVSKQTETEALEGGKVAGGAQQTEARKGKRIVDLTHARVYISVSFNNTLVSVADAQGNVVVWSSAGAMGFKGPKKATPFAASRVVENIFEKLGNVKLGKVHIYVQGVGSGRDGAIRAFAGKGLDIVSIEDTTPLPHNGCRPRKARRV